MNDYEKLLYKSNKQKRQLGILIKKITYYKQELQRKDNIMNDLKEWTNSEINRLETYQDDKASDECWVLKAVLDKIKELEKM